MTTYTHPDNITALPYYQQALRGMAYIDQEHFNKRWYDDVPLDALCMGDPDGDVLEYTLGAQHEGLGLSQELGFYAPGQHSQLTHTWRVLLRLRSQLPPLPDGHVFLGVGKDDNDTGYADVRHCFGWRDGTRWEEKWSLPSTTALCYNYVAYCVDRANPAAQTLLDALPPEDKENTVTQENEPMNDDTPELTLHSSGDGVVYQGYHLTDDDIEKLMTFARYSTSLRGAGFDVSIAEVGVGCQKFTRRQLDTLYAQYKKLKAQPQGFTVKKGDRVEYTPDGAVYIVASVGYTSYLLINTATGSRRNNVVVRNPEDYRRIPLMSFLTDSDALSNWSKV